MKPMNVLRLHKEPVSHDATGGFWRDLLLPNCRTLHAQASFGLGWDHVSVSVAGTHEKTPSWAEMEAVRRFFFEPHETVVQLHPPLDQYVTNTGPHMGVLHLWRKQDSEHALPPMEFV